ncbi:hypothetical protein EPI10_034404 [Gossypium australe]|uniref:Uncharacterized protein n=1 Tax=Gossypium australe TaxID=47621 RepID=A0A5B6U6Q7_9ROSI|nr:hypothetical protein EPI10_034404 [Gossypium australe]
MASSLAANQAKQWWMIFGLNTTSLHSIAYCKAKMEVFLGALVVHMVLLVLD